MSIDVDGSSTLRSVILVLYLQCCQGIRSMSKSRNVLSQNTAEPALYPLSSETSEVGLLATDKIILQTMHMHWFVVIKYICSVPSNISPSEPRSPCSDCKAYTVRSSDCLHSYANNSRSCSLLSRDCIIIIRSNSSSDRRQFWSEFEATGNTQKGGGD